MNAWRNRGLFDPRRHRAQRGPQDNKTSEIGRWEAGGGGPQKATTEEDGYRMKRRDGDEKRVELGGGKVGAGKEG